MDLTQHFTYPTKTSLSTQRPYSILVLCILNVLVLISFQGVI